MDVLIFVAAIVFSLPCAFIGTQLVSFLISDFSLWLRFPIDYQRVDERIDPQYLTTRPALVIKNEPASYTLSLVFATFFFLYAFAGHWSYLFIFGAGLIGAAILGLILASAMSALWLVLWSSHLWRRFYQDRLHSLDCVEHLYRAAKTRLRKGQNNG